MRIKFPSDPQYIVIFYFFETSQGRMDSRSRQNLAFIRNLESYLERTQQKVEMIRNIFEPFYNGEGGGTDPEAIQ